VLLFVEVLLRHTDVSALVLPSEEVERRRETEEKG